MNLKYLSYLLHFFFYFLHHPHKDYIIWAIHTVYKVCIVFGLSQFNKRHSLFARDREGREVKFSHQY